MAVSRALPFVLLGCLFLIAVGCDLVAPPPRDPQPQDVLERSAQAMSAVRSFHFRIEAANGTMPLSGGMAATSIEGDVAAPDRLRMQIKARVVNVPVEMSVIAIGTTSYVTKPTSDQWQDATGSIAAPPLLDPDRGISAALRRVTGPQSLGRDSTGGASAFHIRGALATTAVAGMVGGPPAPGENVGVELWIGSTDSLVRRVRLTGAVLSGESPHLERILSLSDFNKPVSIDPP